MGFGSCVVLLVLGLKQSFLVAHCDSDPYDKNCDARLVLQAGAISPSLGYSLHVTTPATHTGNFLAEALQLTPSPAKWWKSPTPSGIRGRRYAYECSAQFYLPFFPWFCFHPFLSAFLSPSDCNPIYSPPRYCMFTELLEDTGTLRWWTVTRGTDTDLSYILQPAVLPASQTINPGSSGGEFICHLNITKNCWDPWHLKELSVSQLMCHWSSGAQCPAS